jgi:peptidoglycan/xylan/chitin deacetylase (PgdA/CDA1 family)
MKQLMKRILLIVAVAIGGVAIFLVGYHSLHRSIPYSQLITTSYWNRHFKGHDFYDPRGAMLYHGNPKYREVALTIDDGPHKLYGPQILDVLTQYNVPATFFLVGVRVKQEPEIVRDIVAQGHEVGNHTYDHQRLDGLKPHQIANELRDNGTAVYRAAGIKMNIMRPPGVQFNDKVLNVAKTLGYVTVNWNNAARDYQKQTPDYIVRRVVDSTEAGSIILLHQDNPDTAAALPRIIAALQKRGYRFVTVSTMLAHLGVEPYADLEKTAIAARPGEIPVLANGNAYYPNAAPGKPSAATLAKAKTPLTQ